MALPEFLPALPESCGMAVSIGDRLSFALPLPVCFGGKRSRRKALPFLPFSLPEFLPVLPILLPG